MPTILIVEKSGDIKERNVKSTEFGDLFKSAGYKSAEGFRKQATWPVVLGNLTYNVQLYAKSAGRANFENKYDFPPPVDSALFFGNCVLLNVSPEGAMLSLTEPEWNNIYEHLFGGFDDVGDDDSIQDEDELSDGAEITKDGYAKDGFVVSDESSEEEEYIPPKKRAPAKTKIAAAVAKVVKQSLVADTKPATKPGVVPVAEEPAATFLDCASELVEEAYV